MRAILVEEDAVGLGYYVLPEACRRVWRFARKYDESCDPDVLVANVKRNFASELFGEPKLVFLIAVIDADQVVGHVLFCIEPWAGPSVTILQYEMDRAVDEATREQGWRIMEAVADTARARYFQITARSDSDGDRRRARLFRRMGFREVGVVMRRPPAVLRDENPVPQQRETAELKAVQ